MPDIVGDKDQVSRLGARQVADAPGIQLHDLSRILDLHTGTDDRRDLNVATAGRKLVGSISRVAAASAARAAMKLRIIFPTCRAKCSFCLTLSRAWTDKRLEQSERQITRTVYGIHSRTDTDLA